MEDNQQSQDHAPLRASSEEALISPRPPTGGSNRRAVKVAGLTVLACLLLASQALTAYLVINQRGQINTLQKNSDKMSKRLTSRAQVAPVRMHIPMNTMPLLKDFTDEDLEKTETPMTKLQDTAIVSLEMQVTNLLQELNSSLPQFNQTFLANLQSLKTKMMADEWMGLQTWMRHWLIFQMAQQKPSVPVQTLQSKCRLEAAPGRVHPGFYQPQCDEQGHYKPLQCWHSTGYCWCVDSEGNPIPGTRMHGRPICDGAPAPVPGQGLRRMAAMPKTFQLKSLPTDE